MGYKHKEEKYHNVIMAIYDLSKKPNVVKAQDISDTLRNHKIGNSMFSALRFQKCFREKENGYQWFNKKPSLNKRKAIIEEMRTLGAKYKLAYQIKHKKHKIPKKTKRDLLEQQFLDTMPKAKVSKLTKTSFKKVFRLKILWGFFEISFLLPKKWL